MYGHDGCILAKQLCTHHYTGATLVKIYFARALVQ